MAESGNMSKLLSHARRALSKLSLRDQEAFRAINTNKARIGFVFERKELLDSIQGLVQGDKSYEAKSAKKSEELRQQGNALFKKKRFDDALGRFNESLIHAPCSNVGRDQEGDGGSKVLAFAYASRSAALYFMGRYEDCLRDISHAFHCGYSERLRFKMLDRQGKCFQSLGSYGESSGAFANALESLRHADLGPAEAQKWRSSLQKQLDDVSSLDQSTPEVDLDVGSDFSFPELSAKPNSKFPCASEAFRIKSSRDCGRFAEASRDVRVGDVLVVDKAYASVLCGTAKRSHCSECFRQVCAPYPCDACADVVYCGPECKEAAWNKHHAFECEVVGWLTSEWAGDMGCLALRMAVTTDIEEMLTAYLVMKSKKENQPKDALGGKDYAAACRLMGHESDRNLNSDFELTTTAIFLLQVLRRSGYVTSSLNSPTFSNFESELQMHEQVLAEILLHHLQIIQCNGCGISEMENTGDFRLSKPRDVGLGLYTTTSLINHSCSANVEFCYYGNVNVIRATCNIGKGEQIMGDYGPLFLIETKHERRKTLRSHYFFVCQCVPCNDNWPLWSELNSSLPVFKCQGCGKSLGCMKPSETTHVINCSGCGRQLDLEQEVKTLDASHQSYSAAMEMALKGQLQEALPGLHEHLTLLQRSLCQPWQEFFSCQATIKQCYRIMGNSYSGSH